MSQFPLGQDIAWSLIALAVISVGLLIWGATAQAPSALSADPEDSDDPDEHEAGTAAPNTAAPWALTEPLRTPLADLLSAVAKPVMTSSILTAALLVAIPGAGEDRGIRVGALLAADDLPAARDRIRSLVGRDPTHLSADELARAAIESVAENSSDAVVAPLFWGAVAGIPGLLGYRAINTLDAMIGHKNSRYHRFGWAAARLDDLVNWIPARLAAGLAAAAAPLVGGSPGAALRTIRADAHKHPSPNAGPVEAAFAGALGVRLGGTNRYGDRVEDRGTLGDGRPVTPGDIPRANRLAAAVGAGATVLATLGGLARQRFLSSGAA